MRPGSTELLPAPFNIDDISGNIEYTSLDVDVDLTNMKNSIYVIGGTYVKTFVLSPPVGDFTPVDVYTTVNNQLIYPLAYPYDQSSMTVTLAGVPQVLGTDQSTPDADCQVQYNSNGYFLRFTSNPGAGHQIVVQGNARIPILAHVTDAAAIATYGEIQDSIIDSQITSVAEAQERAQAEIAQFGGPVYDVKFTTISSLANGLYIGQSIYLRSTSYGYNASPGYRLVIKRIEAKMRTPTVMEFAVECMGSDVVSYTDMMLFLLQQANAQSTVSDSTVLEILLEVLESISVSDTITITGTSRPYKWGPTSPQNMKWQFFTWS